MMQEIVDTVKEKDREEVKQEWNPNDMRDDGRGIRHLFMGQNIS